MLYILTGEDSYSIGQALHKIERELGDESLRSANTTTLDGQPLNLNELRAACETVPFLAEKRLVIVRGLLQRFEARGRSRRGTRKTSTNSEHGALADYIQQVLESTVLVLIDSGISDHNPLLKAISGRAKVQSFPMLKGERLQQWVKRYLTERGGSASPPAVDQLARLIGGNLWGMANEIEKLLLYTAGRPIEEADVRHMVSQGQEASVFAMVDAILDFKARLAQQLLQQLLQRGSPPAYLMAMLSRQINMIVRAGELKKRGISTREIQTRLGINNEYALRKTLEQAGRHPLERLREIYRQLLETDLSIKTGRQESELALTVLIAGLGDSGENRP